MKKTPEGPGMGEGAPSRADGTILCKLEGCRQVEVVLSPYIEGRGCSHPYPCCQLTDVHQAPPGTESTAVDGRDLVSAARNSESGGEWGGQTTGRGRTECYLS